jgi:lipid-binding SYLF domain-containing protein
MKQTLLVVTFTALALLVPGVAAAATVDKASLDKEVKASLDALNASEPGAKALAAQAKAILVFPTMRKAGLILGGQGSTATAR